MHTHTYTYVHNHAQVQQVHSEPPPRPQSRPASAAPAQQKRGSVSFAPEAIAIPIYQQEEKKAHGSHGDISYVKTLSF